MLTIAIGATDNPKKLTDKSKNICPCWLFNISFLTDKNVLTYCLRLYSTINTPIRIFHLNVHIILVRMICFLVAYDQYSCQNEKSANWPRCHTFRSKWSVSFDYLRNWSTFQKVYGLISCNASSSSRVLCWSLCYRLKVTFLGFKLPV